MSRASTTADLVSGHIPEQAAAMITCGWCGADLVDEHGNLRADVFTGLLPGRGRNAPPGELLLVCYEGCESPAIWWCACCGQAAPMAAPCPHCGAWARQSSPVDGSLAPAPQRREVTDV